MEPRRAPEYILEIFADPDSVKDIVKGAWQHYSHCWSLLLKLCSCFRVLSNVTNILSTAVLHTIFFHRYFPSIRPQTRDLLDITLPCISDYELETLVENKTELLKRQIDTTSNTRSSSVRGQITVQFFEKRRKKAWFSKAEEEVCWEQWTLDVTLATPKTESGKLSHGLLPKKNGCANELIRSSQGSESNGDSTSTDCFENSHAGQS
jgi:hypothetical protein